MGLILYYEIIKDYKGLKISWEKELTKIEIELK